MMCDYQWASRSRGREIDMMMDGLLGGLILQREFLREEVVPWKRGRAGFNGCASGFLKQISTR